MESREQAGSVGRTDQAGLGGAGGTAGQRGGHPGERSNQRCHLDALRSLRGFPYRYRASASHPLGGSNLRGTRGTRSTAVRLGPMPCPPQGGSVTLMTFHTRRDFLGASPDSGLLLVRVPEGFPLTPTSVSTGEGREGVGRAASEADFVRGECVLHARPPATVQRTAILTGLRRTSDPARSSLLRTE